MVNSEITMSKIVKIAQATIKKRLTWNVRLAICMASSAILQMRVGRKKRSSLVLSFTGACRGEVANTIAIGLRQLTDTLK